VALGLCALTLFVFFQAANFTFINLDDDKYVSDNPVIQKGLTVEGVKYAFTSFSYFYWHPVTWLSHMLDCQLFGLDAGWHHLTNVLLHTANVLLVFLVLLRLTGAFWRSALVAALFAIHPLRVESVAWIAERKDLLACLFWMLTMWMYVGYVKGTGPEARKKYLLALLMFLLAIMSKPTVVTLTFALLLLDYWPLERLSLASVGRLIKEKIPFFLLSALSAVITYLGQKQFGAVREVSPPGTRITSVVASYAQYLCDLVWPRSLGVLYPPSHSIPGRTIVLSVVSLAVITAVVLWRARKSPYLPTGWFWFLGVLVPMSGIVQVGLVVRADRFTYIPAIGFFILIVWAASAVATRYSVPTKMLVYISAAVLAILAAQSWVQARYWRTAESLYAHSIAVTDSNPILKNSLGVTLMHEHRVVEAERYFRSALADDPSYVDGYNNLGIALIQEGRWTEAVAVTTQVLHLKPKDASAFFTLAVALNELHRFPQALQAFQGALQYGLPPDLAAAARQSVESLAQAQALANSSVALSTKTN